MARASWALQGDRPVVEISLLGSSDRTANLRTPLADTGAGSRRSKFELVLSADDCRQFGVWRLGTTPLQGAYVGRYPVHSVMIEIPSLSVVRHVPTVAVPATQLPSGLHGIAGFRFLRQFAFGNFGDPDGFGLEVSA